MGSVYENMTYKQLAKEFNVSYNAIKHLIGRRGMTPDKAKAYIKERNKRRRARSYTPDQLEIALSNGISERLLYNRLYEKMPMMDAITKKPRGKNRKYYPGEKLSTTLEILNVTKDNEITVFRLNGKVFRVSM